MNNLSKKFYWSGIKDDVAVKGTLYAYNFSEAKQSLTKQNIKIRYLYQERKTISPKKQVLLFKQLSALLVANISIIRTMEIIKNTTDDLSIKNKMIDSIDRLQQGNSIATIFSDLDHFYIQLLKIGEKSGRIDQAFEKIAFIIEEKWQTKKKIIKTLTYPFILLLVSLLILGELFIWVIPQFQIIFNEFHAALPLLTQVFILISTLLSKHFVFIFSSISILMCLLSYVKKIPLIEKMIEQYSFKIPIVSFLKTHHYASHFFLGVSILLESGISITDALLNVKNSLESQYFETIVHHIILKIRQGHSLHQALQQSGFFPSIAIQMIKIAEETGKLDVMFNYLTHYHQQQFNDALITLQQLLEPIIMLIMALFVGILLFALYLPIFKLGSIF